MNKLIQAWGYMLTRRQKYAIKLKTLPAYLFDADNLPKYGRDIPGDGNHHDFTHSVDMGEDSYIIGAIGHRGAGKSEFLTFIAFKCALLWGKRIVSNYDMLVRIKYANGKCITIRSEAMDFEKILNFDESYEDCIFVIDEAPQIINRLATMTWKNRLLNLWIQQIRKTGSSLLYGSQAERLVDGELQEQTDIIAYCSDAFRKYPGSGVKRGGIVLINLVDKSGMWTGSTLAERQNMNLPTITLKGNLEAEILWNTFDSMQKQDVFTSLMRVEMNLGSYRIDKGDRGSNSQFVNDYRDKAIAFVEKAMQSNNPCVYRNALFKGLGIQDNIKAKRDIADALSKGDIIRDRDNKDWLYSFKNFNVNNFLKALGKV